MTSRLRSLRLASLAAAAGLAGCAATVSEPPAPVEAPAAFRAAARHGPASEAGAPGAEVQAAWWRVYDDPVLDDLEERLVVGNENLRSALAAAASARASVEASRAAFWPTLSLGVDGGRARTPNVGRNGRGVVDNNVGLTVDAGWEPDLWGRLAHAGDAAQANGRASEEDLAALRLALQAQLVQTYVALRLADAQDEVLRRSVESFERALALTEARHAGGVASRADVLQAESQLADAQARRADVAAQRAPLAHAIAVLLGVAPSALEIAARAALPKLPRVPVQLPSDLLRRRPDVGAARERVLAAHHEIGAAQALYFPQVMLSASGGYRHDALQGLIGLPTQAWSLGAAVVQTILDGGQRRLVVAQAKASADQATSAYRQAVLGALQEVEDNLVLADELAREAEWRARAVDTLRRGLDVTRDRYRAGTLGYLDVMTVQAGVLDGELQLLAVRARQLDAAGLLLKNLAGRWPDA